MAALSETEDAYAADVEESQRAATKPRRQRSTNVMKNREFGLYANRLRHRPQTRQESTASDSAAGWPPQTHDHHQDDQGHLDFYQGSGSGSQAHSNSRRQHLNHPYFDDYNTTTTDSAPQLPPLPISPISPRWASLANGHTIPFDQANASSSPLIAAAASETRSRATSSASSSKFPGLSSHPYTPSLGQYASSDRSSYSAKTFSPADGRDEPASTVTSTPTSPTFCRPDSRQAGEGVHVGNFSRPRKPSMRQQHYVETPSRLHQPGTLHVDGKAPPPSFHYPAWQQDRDRGLSVSSSQSTSTHHSLPRQPSNDHLRYNRPPAAAVGAVHSPVLPRTPVTYSRGDHHNANFNAAPGSHFQSREATPWIVDDELRSSYRSQWTSSTAPPTVFTASGTERSSVLTKASSHMSYSQWAGGNGTADEGLSVEDVMGMYEQGFADSTGAEDNDAETHDDGYEMKDASAARRDHLRSETRPSENGRLENTVLEAMSDPLPIPSRGFAKAQDDPYVLRDSGAFFRNSGLPSSLPNDIGLNLAPDHTSRTAQTEDASIEKHDSGKSLGDIEPASVQRQDSDRSVRTATPSPPAAQNAHEAALQLPQQPQPTQAEAEKSKIKAEDLPPPPPPHSPALYAATEEEEPNSRDRYGFRKHNQYVSRGQFDEWNGPYSEYLARRRKKWVAYLKDSGLMTDHPNRFPPPSAKTKRFIRKGIPPDWRGAAWFYYAGGPGILAKHPGAYDQLLKRVGQGEVKEVDAESIERDLHRTFPDNQKFKFAAGQQGSGDAMSEHTKVEEPLIISSLRRVLLAFSVYNPQIGYCQSLNFLAGLLLLFVESEEQCFWLLNVITRVYLPGTHEMSLEGSKVDLSVLMATLKNSMPHVWDKVAGEMEDPNTGSVPPTPTTPKYGTLGRRARRPRGLMTRSATSSGVAASVDRLPPITLCMTAWFMSCFIGTLPMETTLRVWDVFFYEGSKTLFRVALGVFKLGEQEIRAVQDPMEMFGVVQTIPRRLVDCNKVMETTFKKRGGFGDLTQNSIEEKRTEGRNALKEARRAAAAAAAANKQGDGLGDGRHRHDLGDLTDVEGDVRRKGTLFGRRRGREKARAAEVM